MLLMAFSPPHKLRMPESSISATVFLHPPPLTPPSFFPIHPVDERSLQPSAPHPLQQGLLGWACTNRNIPGSSLVASFARQQALHSISSLWRRGVQLHQCTHHLRSLFLEACINHPFAPSDRSVSPRLLLSLQQDWLTRLLFPFHQAPSHRVSHSS